MANRTPSLQALTPVPVHDHDRGSARRAHLLHQDPSREHYRPYSSILGRYS